MFFWVVASVLVAGGVGYLIAVISRDSQVALWRERLSQQTLTATELQARLDRSEADEQRLTNEIDELKKDLEKARQAQNQSQEKRHEAERQLDVAQADNRSAENQLNELKETLDRREKERVDLQERFQNLGKEHSALQTSLEEKENNFKQRLEELSDAKKAFTSEFENIANKLFEQKNKSFAEASQMRLGQILKPLGDQIERFEKRVNEVHDAATKGNADLTSELDKVREVSLRMSREASDLTNALKGDSQKRGAWGEAQLRRTLEASGLIKGEHFNDQDSFRDAEGRLKRPDFVVTLPDGNCIIIDSKVTLQAYQKLTLAENTEDRELALGEHVKAVRGHIDDLARKNYPDRPGDRSPDFVLMFMPVEPAYIEALKSDRELFEYGYSKGVVLVSHTTLIPILRTVSNLWILARSNKEVREISELAGDIYNQVCLVSERLERLGNSLNTASNHYEETVTALAGRQGLHGKVNRFKRIVTTTKQLPDLEQRQIGFDVERLKAIEVADGDTESPEADAVVFDLLQEHI